MPQRLSCPTCDRPIEWTEAFPFRPFCSERCRLIDLGAWLSEQRAIPGEPATDPGATLPGGSAGASSNEGHDTTPGSTGSGPRVN